MDLPLEKDLPIAAGVPARYVAGIDEAGRGPVLGPLVYALCYTAESNLAQVKDLKVADSKTLKAEKRSELFQQMAQEKHIGWTTKVLDPAFISNQMFLREKINLNTLSHQAIVSMIRTVQSKTGNALSQVWIDTVGPPETLQSYLSKQFPTIKFTVSKKADSLYPIVSAASIIAKVIRDSRLDSWDFGSVLDRDFGSGYPADPITISWLKRNCDPVFGYPQIIRFSWSTTETALDNYGGSQIRWPVHKPSPTEPNPKRPKTTTVLSFFKGLKTESKYDALKRHIRPWNPK